MTADNALTTPDCLLTLAVPAALEEDVLDLLRTLPHMAPGFTLVPAQGMGAHIHLASSMEQVQGRARRVLVQLAIVQTQVEPLIDALRKALPTPQIAYWAAPLLAFGRLGSLS